MFEDKRWLMLPAPIADAVGEMLRAIDEEGQHTTADETAAAIEATFNFLGRVWVAEYLAALASDRVASAEHLNRDLFERVAGAKPVFCGQWVGIARAARDVFEESGADTVYKGLRKVDFGTFQDEVHRVARLIDFRNHFSHGSFNSTVEQISAHRAMLDELLSDLPCLVNQPVIVVDPDTGQRYEASGEWRASTLDADVEPGHPVVIGGNGEKLSLYPLLEYKSKEKQVLGPPAKGVTVSLLTEHEQVAAWQEKYNNERRGNLLYPEVPQARLPEGIGDDFWDAVAEGGLILVEAHPGCGVSAVVPALNPGDSHLKGFDAVKRVDVRVGEVSQSGFTVARVVLRTAEELLGIEFKESLATILKPDGDLKSATDQLEKKGKKILLAINNLHNGTDPYRGEQITVRNVYESLADTCVTVVATTVAGFLWKPVFDSRVSIDLPPGSVPVADEVTEWVERLCSKSALHTKVLTVLAGSVADMDLFSICEALEDGDEMVFEPAVERALWDMRPLLSTSRDEREIEGKIERVRIWKAFFKGMKVPEAG